MSINEADKELKEKTVYPKKAKPKTQHDKLRESLKCLFGVWDASWEKDLPKKWKIAQDLLILPPTCFKSSHWTAKCDSKLFWKTVADSFKLNRIVQENKVQPDDFRTPNFTLLLGDNSQVTVINNGIKYSYDFTKCMFSWGNITEKLRIADFDCSNEVVVDLYAGIGYFTLVYLIHAKAKFLIACEWNKASVEALKHNLIINNCQDRCQILEGDNRETCPNNCADRVNLGLIPTSEPSWKTACYALKKESGGYLHIHGNVDLVKREENLNCKEKPDWIEWANKTKDKIEEILNERTADEYVKWNIKIDHIEYVKSYGPRVDHLVLDLLCKPLKLNQK